MVIFRHHIRREASALIGWAIAVIALVVLQTSLFGVLQTPALAAGMASVWHNLPPQFLQFVGGALNVFSVSGWIGTIDLSGWITLIVGIWVALASVSVVARDVDQGTLEFLLAMPVRRGRLLGERSLSLVLQLVLIYIGIFAAVVIAVALMGRSVSDLRVAEALGVLLLDQAALAGTLVLVSLFLREQTYAVLTTVTVAAVFIFIPVFVGANAPVAFLRRLTPFDYDAAGSLMLHGTYPAGQAVVAVVWAASAFLAAWVVFARREL